MNSGANVRLLVCSSDNPQPCLDPPKSKGHDGQRQISWVGKMYWKVTTLRMQLRGGVCVQSGRAAVFACGRLGMANAQAHLIGQWGVAVWLAKARLSMRVPCEMSKPLACLRGRLVAREMAVGCSHGDYTNKHAHVLQFAAFCVHSFLQHPSHIFDRGTWMGKNDVDLRSLSTHPQIQVSCSFQKVCLVHHRLR